MVAYCRRGFQSFISIPPRRSAVPPLRPHLLLNKLHVSEHVAIYLLEEEPTTEEELYELPFLYIPFTRIVPSAENDTMALDTADLVGHRAGRYFERAGPPNKKTSLFPGGAC